MTDSNFQVLLIDEAAQASEPELLVPMVRLGRQINKVVLIGDQNQLPATILSDQPELAQSLFERCAIQSITANAPYREDRPSIRPSRAIQDLRTDQLERTVGQRVEELLERICYEIQVFG